MPVHLPVAAVHPECKEELKQVSYICAMIRKDLPGRALYTNGICFIQEGRRLLYQHL